MTSPDENRTPVELRRVRERLDESAREGLRAFWQAQDTGMSEAQAAMRLPRVLARLVDEEGRTVGSSSATPMRIPAIGNQWFQVYRCLIASAHDDAENWLALLRTGWEILAEPAQRTMEPHCIGVFAAIPQDSPAAGWRQALWPDSRFLHAGTGRDGAAFRIRYFEDARIDEGDGHG